MHVSLVCVCVLSYTHLVMSVSVPVQLGGVGGARGSLVPRSGHGAGRVEEEDDDEGGQETNSESTHTHTHTHSHPYSCGVHIYRSRWAVEAVRRPQTPELAEHLFASGRSSCTLF